MTGLRNSGTRREKRGRLEDSDSDTVMNHIIGFTPCNFCDDWYMYFKFVANHPALAHYYLLQDDASLAGTFFSLDGIVTFGGDGVPVLSGAGKALAARAGAHCAAPLLWGWPPLSDRVSRVRPVTPLGRCSESAVDQPAFGAQRRTVASYFRYSIRFADANSSQGGSTT